MVLHRSLCYVRIIIKTEWPKSHYRKDNRVAESKPLRHAIGTSEKQKQSIMVNVAKDGGLIRGFTSNSKPTFYAFNFSPATPTFRGCTQLPLANCRVRCTPHDGRGKGRQLHCLLFLLCIRQVDCARIKPTAQRSYPTYKIFDVSD